LMLPGHFQFPMMLIMNHMMASWIFTSGLRLCCPSAFPALEHIEVNWTFRLKFLALGAMFCASIVFAIEAYNYLSLSLLQVIKHSNIVIIYALSVLCGLEAFKRCSVMILAGILLGVLMAVQGEVHFQLFGFLFQMAGCLAEAGKVVSQGLLMRGSAKLDALTLVLFMAPACLLANLLPFSVWEAHRAPEILAQFLLHYPMILANMSLAVALNVMIAVCIKHFSPVGYLVMGILKDIVIVSTSSIFLGESLTVQQICGFSIALSGVAAYSLYKQNIDFFVEDQLTTGFARVASDWSTAPAGGSEDEEESKAHSSKASECCNPRASLFLSPLEPL